LVYKESYPLGSSDIAAIAHLKDNPKLLETINIESKERSKQDYGTEEPEIEIRKDKSTKQVELVGQVEEAKEVIDEDNAILSKISNTASTVAEEL
jgi:hypothetical protein